MACVRGPRLRRHRRPVGATTARGRDRPHRAAPHPRGGPPPAAPGALARPRPSRAVACGPRPRPPLLPEVRWHGRDHGASLLANLHDAIAALEALATVRTPTTFAVARCRLLERLYWLQDAAPGQVRLREEAGAPETLLHGDLGPKNIFVAMAADRPSARLIDWDHVGVGPASYDVSTLLYQSAPDDRPWMLCRYREALECAGHRLPSDRELNALFYAAETARGVSSIIWPAMALLHDGAEWGRRTGHSAP